MVFFKVYNFILVIYFREIFRVMYRKCKYKSILYIKKKKNLNRVFKRIEKDNFKKKKKIEKKYKWFLNIWNNDLFYLE